MNEKTKKKIQELQVYEQNLQVLLMQKQAFQIELTETENALSEISKSKDDIFKLVGQIMVKTDKEKIQDELKKKQGLFSLRLRSIEKQESEITKELENLREEVVKEIR